MEQSMINIEYKRIEQKLSEIGAKIATATDLSHQAKELVIRSECVLMNAQREIESLYISLENEDILNTQNVIKNNACRLPADR